MNYSPELKDALLRRMLPPNNESITKIAKEEGISEQTLRSREENGGNTRNPWIIQSLHQCLPAIF